MGKLAKIISLRKYKALKLINERTPFPLPREDLVNQSLIKVPLPMSDAKQRGRRNRQRGNEHEREVAKSFRTLYPDAKRKYEFRASDVDGCDLEDTGIFNIQCKRKKAFSVYKLIEEIKVETGVNLLVVRGDGKKNLAIMELEDLIALLFRIPDLK